MLTVRGHFDEIHSTESTFGEPTLDGDCLRIPAPKIVLLQNHALYRILGSHLLDRKCDWLACQGELIFLGARSSERSLIEYIGNRKCPSGFKPEVRIVDFRHPGSRDLESFCFEGFSAPRNAWILEWRIEAQSFLLEVADDPQLPLIDPA